MTARRAWMVAALVPLTACSSAVTEPPTDLVASWSEDDDLDWVADVRQDPEVVVLGDDAERDSWLERLPGAVAADDSFDPLRAVDLTESFLLIGGYPRCTEHSVITVSGEGDVVFEVRDDEEETLCAWAPYTVDAWAVPLELTDGQAPRDLELRDVSE